MPPPVKVVQMCTFCFKRPAADYHKGRLICWRCLEGAKRQHLEATEGRARRRGKANGGSQAETR